MHAYLLGTTPFLPVPLLVQEELVVLVGYDGGGECPWTFESTTIGVASAKSVSTTESYDFLVVETHTPEDITQMLVSLGCVWQTSIGCAAGNILIGSSRSVWDNWALHFLNSDDA